MTMGLAELIARGVPSDAFADWIAAQEKTSAEKKQAELEVRVMIQGVQQGNFQGSREEAAKYLNRFEVALGYALGEPATVIKDMMRIWQPRVCYVTPRDGNIVVVIEVQAEPKRILPKNSTREYYGQWSVRMVVDADGNATIQ